MSHSSLDFPICIHTRPKARVYSQLPLRRTPLGPAPSVRLRQVSVL